MVLLKKKNSPKYRGIYFLIDYKISNTVTCTDRTTDLCIHNENWTLNYVT